MASATPPKLRLEVRRGARAGKPQAPAADAADQDHSHLFAPDADDDGFAGMRFPGAAPAQASDAAAPDDGLAAEIEAVKAERLSPRQLRVANRIAVSQGIAASSDEEAVALLRRRGIDPLDSAALRRVVADEGQRASATPSRQAPSVVGRDGAPGKPRPVVPLPDTMPALPSREQLTEDRRAAEIFRIQRDIARRRRRRMFALLARLAAFVALPTILAGWYYFAVATPLFATVSAFQIQKAEAASPAGLGSLFAGTQLATNPDSVAVQTYLGSREAMMRLDEEIGFKRVFQDPSIDPLLRLPPDATNEDAYDVYRNSVKISYDPTEGVIGMEVIAPDPQLSEQYSLALLRYAEDQVDQMSARLRSDQMEGAIESYSDAEARVQEAQVRIQELQQRLGVLDPVAEGSAAMAQIAQLETELTAKQLELGQLQANARPNQSRVAGVEGDIARLERMIAERRGALTESSSARSSLATVTGELRIAEGDLLTRQQLLASAAAQMEAARIEANKQVRYLSLAVTPVPPDQPTYPKAVQNTVVAFLIFAGIYLMLSLTASILREQVST
ncbi:capsule biosynthesis protein [Paracoccus sp. S-4012]|uniref:capsule biosynthesis protein n=1 Tax=Paracoccus sp. S-4012 TaxID=2665648 RepID=UPI00351AD512